MGFFDKFKSKFARIGEVRKPKPARVEKRNESVAAKTADAESPRPSASQVGVSGQIANRTLVKPLVTEKTAILAAVRKYVFVVQPRATKLEVKQAVRELYGTLPESVDMIKRAGKVVRFGQRIGERKDWKKAIVTMPEGKTLPIYE